MKYIQDTKEWKEAEKRAVAAFEAERWLDTPNLTEAEKEEWRESYRKSMLKVEAGGKGSRGGGLL